jgi:hypothetical protein
MRHACSAMDEKPIRAIGIMAETRRKRPRDLSQAAKLVVDIPARPRTGRPLETRAPRRRNGAGARCPNDG